MKYITYDIVNKKVCNHDENKCFHLKPYNMLDIGNDNSTQKEKEMNVRKYKNTCSNRNGVLEKCCSKMENDIKNIDYVLKKAKKKNIWSCCL